MIIRTATGLVSGSHLDIRGNGLTLTDGGDVLRIRQKYPLRPQSGEELLDMVAYGQRTDTSDWAIELSPIDYNISEPIIISSLAPIHIYGENANFPDLPGKVARIISASPDVPAFIIQGDRGSHLEDFHVSGPNDFSLGFPTFYELLDDSTFLVGDVRDNRYSPQGGIIFDPITNGSPGGNDANRYPGLEALYSGMALRGTGSSGTRLTRISVSKCNVAFGMAVGGLANCENIHFEACYSTICRSHVVIGGTQARGVYFSKLSAYGGQTWLDTSRYGVQTGASPQIFGANIGAMQRVFNIVTGKGNFTATGVYCEVVCSLGNFGNSAAGAPASAVLVGLEASFLSPQNAGQHQSAATVDYHIANFMPVKFVGGQLAPRSPGQNELFRAFNQAPLSFDCTDLAGFAGVGATANNIPISFHRADLARLADCKVTDGVTGAKHIDTRAVSYATTAVGSAEVTHTAGAVGGFTLNGHGCSIGDVIYTSTPPTGWHPKFLPAQTAYTGHMAIGRVSAVAGDDVTITGIPESLVPLLPETYTLQRRALAFG